MIPAEAVRLAVFDSLHRQSHDSWDRSQLSSAAWKPLSGGSINQSYRVDIGLRCFFVKLHAAKYSSMFEAEAVGLGTIADTKTIRVPDVYACTADEHASWLVMEYINLASHTHASEQLFARQLAMMHGCMGESFGWVRDNTIGTTPQCNRQHDDWFVFYREHRLAYQLQLAKQNGLSLRLLHKGEELQASLQVFFKGYQPQPSLLHGDLWSGNFSADSVGQPVIYDPAVYYGDRETDIAMTELFGGLSDSFYTAYDELYPLDAGYGVRKKLYNLYHILNHANLFGASYVSQAENMMDSLLAEC